MWYKYKPLKVSKYIFQYFLIVSSLQSEVMNLNPKQIDTTSKTLLDLQARCVADRIKLQVTKRNPETHYVKGKVRNAQ